MPDTITTAGRLLLDRSERSAPAGTSAQAQIPVGPFKRAALIFVTAHGTSRYQGPTANAGIILTIRAGSHAVKDDSFEGESSSIAFHATASHVFTLPAGASTNVQALVEPYGAGGQARNRDTEVDLHVVALDVG